MPPTRGTKTFFKHLLQSGVVVHGGIRKTPSVETVVLGVDDDESASPALGNHGQSLRSENKLQDTEQLCEFPVGRSPNVTVTFHDYKTLEHDFFLNDIIIDFYLTYLHENMLNKEDASKVYILGWSRGWSRSHSGKVQTVLRRVRPCVLDRKDTCG